MILTLPAETEVRLQTLAAQRHQAPEAVIDAALEALLREAPDKQEAMPGQEVPSEQSQEHLSRLLLAATEQAKLVQAEPADSPARTYYRESKVGRIIAEKFRKQGFDVD